MLDKLKENLTSKFYWWYALSFNLLGNFLRFVRYNCFAAVTLQRECKSTVKETWYMSIFFDLKMIIFQVFLYFFIWFYNRKYKHGGFEIMDRCTSLDTFQKSSARTTSAHCPRFTASKKPGKLSRSFRRNVLHFPNYFWAMNF